MSGSHSYKRIPEHLVGTREGLFHLLRGTEIMPEEKPFIRARLPEISRFGDVLLRSNSPRYVQRAEPAENERIAKLLFDDEFQFNR